MKGRDVTKGGKEVRKEGKGSKEGRKEYTF